MGHIEIWKDVSGYKELYKISNYGKIKRLIGWKCLRERILKPGNNGRGHGWVYLYKNNRREKYYIHRLVLKAFTGLCPEGMECCHNDGNPGNNFIGNLRWDTHKNNNQDKVKHGTLVYGSKIKQSKLNNQDIIDIRNRYINGEYGTEIAKDYGVKFSAIYKILRHESWKHVK